MSNSTEDLNVVASKFVVWQVNFVWTSSRPRLSKVMLLTVTPSLRAEAAEKMRPLRYHTTRGGGLPRSKKKIHCICCGLSTHWGKSLIRLLKIYFKPNSIQTWSKGCVRIGDTTLSLLGRKVAVQAPKRGICGVYLRGFSWYKLLVFFKGLTIAQNDN